ncbi:hypothetical protein [uncultured phage_Deep-GF0-KM16-C193]|uniref:Uncharacterized protein n=1 Tax=uncultured phage_Deep-GF0-KM16-C193 TaxID=2740799 RepID=A0A1B1IWQ0_9CAUD|nr:hypothetical protein HOU06_gp31 [uncultured phage_Deep-GF0-KM16-C193]ANS05765.1 hypothetical protein [uncultured phage_Deep-GF0-KM16-C193]
MTDTSKFKNVSLDLKTYDLLKQQSKQICDVDLSVSQTVRHNASITQQMLDSPNFVKPLRGSKTYQKWKTRLMAKYFPMLVSKDTNANTH